MVNFSFGKALPSHFYAVGVGPGAPDLVTLRAANIIRSADLIIAPKSARSETSLSLQIVQDIIEPWQKVVTRVYAMERNEEQTNKNWSMVAQEIGAYIKEGKSVVQITIGDPLVYSTSIYLINALQKLIPESAIHVVPGISAFQAGAAAVCEPLTIQEDRLTLMSARDLDAVANALDHSETVVLYKSASVMNELYALLSLRGLVQSTRVICYVEQQGKEAIYFDMETAAKLAHGYMATVIIRTGQKKWNNE
jgi:precorrin-2/cobalt-factor-2 C20-methyltransferase